MKRIILVFAILFSAAQSWTAEAQWQDERTWTSATGKTFDGRIVGPLDNEFVFLKDDKLVRVKSGHVRQRRPRRFSTRHELYLECAGDRSQTQQIWRISSQ